jgi:hypothetical protein
MAKKGQKNLRGKPEKWDELKKRVNIMLTPTSINGLDTLATTLGISRSELVERIGRGVIRVQVDTLDLNRGAM